MDSFYSSIKVLDAKGLWNLEGMSQHLKVEVTWEQYKLTTLEVWNNTGKGWRREPLGPNELKTTYAVQTIYGFWICKGNLPHLE